MKDAEKKSVVQLKQSQLSFVQDIPAFFLNVVEGTIFEDHGVVYGPKIIVKISGKYIFAKCFIVFLIKS